MSTVSLELKPLTVRCLSAFASLSNRISSFFDFALRLSEAKRISSSDLTMSIDMFSRLFPNSSSFKSVSGCPDAQVNVMTTFIHLSRSFSKDNGELVMAIDALYNLIYNRPASDNLWSIPDELDTFRPSYDTILNFISKYEPSSEYNPLAEVLNLSNMSLSWPSGLKLGTLAKSLMSGLTPCSSSTHLVSPGVRANSFGGGVLSVFGAYPAAVLAGTLPTFAHQSHITILDDGFHFQAYGVGPSDAAPVPANALVEVVKFQPGKYSIQYSIRQHGAAAVAVNTSFLVNKADATITDNIAVSDVTGTISEGTLILDFPTGGLIYVLLTPTAAANAALWFEMVGTVDRLSDSMGVGEAIASLQAAAHLPVSSNLTDAYGVLSRFKPSMHVIREYIQRRVLSNYPDIETALFNRLSDAKVSSFAGSDSGSIYSLSTIISSTKGVAHRSNLVSFLNDFLLLETMAVLDPRVSNTPPLFN